MTTLEHLQHDAYERVCARELPDFHSEGLVLRHKKTGARICLIVNEDNNKVFSIAFRTPPANGTGVPHIIEHTVLCGSQKYPLKDPFIELEKGSLQTFLNAMTYPDKTVYPVASCNDKDFQNLMDVYLDAVFHPNIYKHREIFMQEGWHYELESPDDELTINGVVYSEMKGAFSSADDVLSREIQCALFPDTTYGQESGGDPEEIPKLTYEEYLDFHKRYYHPSNSYIFLYGDMDMEEKLDYLDREVLSHYDYEPVDSEIHLQQPLGHRRVEITYPMGEEESPEGKTFLTYNAVLGSSLDLKRSIAWEVIVNALLNCPGAPVRQALIDAGIGDDVVCSFDDEIAQTMISIIARNARPEQEEDFVRILREVFEKQCKEGIRKSSLLATLNNMEFQYRENDCGSYPRGLMQGLHVLTCQLYDDSRVFDCLELGAVYEELRAEVDTGYFERLIEEQFLACPHTVVLVANPEPGLATKKEQELQDSLAAYKASLSEEELQKIIDDTKRLREYQNAEEAPEALASIPLLSLSDIGTKAEPLCNEECRISDMPVVLHDIATNGIAYLALYFDVTQLPAEELPYASLLAGLLGMVDTEKHTYLDLADELNLHTGGLSLVLDTFSTERDYRAFSGFFEIRVKAFYRELPATFALLQEILTTSKLDDKKRLKEIVAEGVLRLQSILERRGHTTASSRASSYHDAGEYFLQQIKGVDYLHFLCRLNEEFEERADDTIAHMKRVLAYMLCEERLTVSLTAESEGYRKLEELIPTFAKSVLKKASDSPIAPASQLPWLGGYPLEKKNEGFTYAGQVNYVARSGNFRKAGIRCAGSDRVLRTMLSLDYLWNRVRVEGGAYGCMCSFAPVSGTAFFVSYRDPKLAETNEVFEGMADYVEHLELADRELTKYIIGTIGSIDVPKTPKMLGDRSMNHYFIGSTMEELQRVRDEILGATVEQLRQGAALLRAAMAEDCLCVLGGERAVKENEAMFCKTMPLKNTGTKEEPARVREDM